MESLIDEVKRLLSDSNYVAAGMIVRECEAPDKLRYEALGLAVGAAIDALTVEKNRERIVYLRTILSWYFREVPELSRLYREQLRLIHGRNTPWQDLSKVMQFFRDLGAGSPDAEAPKSGPERAKEFTDKFKEKSEEFQDQVKDFFAQSGIDLDEGMKRANDFFGTISGKRKDDRDEPKDVNEE